MSGDGRRTTASGGVVIEALIVTLVVADVAALVWVAHWTFRA